MSEKKCSKCQKKEHFRYGICVDCFEKYYKCITCGDWLIGFWDNCTVTDDILRNGNGGLMCSDCKRSGNETLKEFNTKSFDLGAWQDKNKSY